jgi:hypothetical protein
MVVMRCPDRPDLAGLDIVNHVTDDHIPLEQDKVSTTDEGHVFSVFATKHSERLEDVCETVALWRARSRLVAKAIEHRILSNAPQSADGLASHLFGNIFLTRTSEGYPGKEDKSPQQEDTHVEALFVADCHDEGWDAADARLGVHCLRIETSAWFLPNDKIAVELIIQKCAGV